MSVQTRMRARSFRLRPDIVIPQVPDTPPKELPVDTSSILTFARQVSVYAVNTLLGLSGCAPGVRAHKVKRVPRALIAGTGVELVGFEPRSAREIRPNDDVIFDAAEKPEDAGTGESEGGPDQDPPSMELDAPNGIQVPSQSDVELSPVETLPHEIAIAAPPPNHADSAPIAPAEHAKIRADVVRKFTAFTAARLSRVPAPAFQPDTVPSLPATPTTQHDDPFATTTADLPSTPRTPTQLEFVPAHPLRLHLPSLQFRANHLAMESPTPVPRPGRLPLRQQTVFFKQPAIGAVSPDRKQPPPEYWSPHPAKGRSCAIPIKAPPQTPRVAAGDKENSGVV